MITSTNLALATKKIPSNKSIVDVFGNPLLHLSTNEDTLDSVVEVIKSMNDTKNLPNNITKSQKEIDLLFQYDPSIYWKFWFPEPYRHDVDYLKKALTVPSYQPSHFSMVPEKLKNESSIFLYFLSQNYLNCVLSYSPDEIAFHLDMKNIDITNEISFWIWNCIYSGEFTYLNLEQDLHPETTYENRLMKTLCTDMKNRRSLYLECLNKRSDKLGLQTLLNLIPLRFLVKMNKEINSVDGKIVYQDKIAEIFKKTIFKKKFLSPISLVVNFLNIGFPIETKAHYLERIEKQKSDEWNKLQFNGLA